MAQLLGASITRSNPYETLREQYELTPWYDASTWKKKQASGDLLLYMGTIDLAQQQLNYDDFRNTPEYKYLEHDQLYQAIETELGADRTQIKTFTDTYTDTYGQTHTETFTGTEYDYYKQILKSLSDYNFQQYTEKIAQEEKDQLNWFLKLNATLASVGGEILFSAFESVEHLANLVVATINGFTTAASGTSLAMNSKEGRENIFANFASDFDEGFRNSFIPGTDESYMLVLENSGLEDALVDFEAKYTWLRRANGEVEGVGKLIIGATDSIGQMLPYMLLNMIPGVGQGLSTTLYWTSMTSSDIQDMINDPRMASVPTWQITLNAGLQAAAEVAMEKLVNLWFNDVTISDHLLYGTAMKDVAIKRGGKAIGAITKKLLLDAAHEGVEEVMQTFADWFVDQAFSTMSEEFAYMSDIEFSTMFDAFTIAAITSLVTGSFSLSTTKRQYTTETTSDGKITAKKMSKAESYLYNLQVAQMLTDLDDAVKNEKLSKEERQSKLLQAITAFQTIASVTGAMGETRAKNAIEFLKKIQDASSVEGVAKLLYDETGYTAEDLKELGKTEDEIVKEIAKSINKKYGKNYSVGEAAEVVLATYYGMRDAVKAEYTLQKTIEKKMKKGKVVYDAKKDGDGEKTDPEFDAKLQKIVDEAPVEITKIVETDGGTDVFYSEDNNTLFIPKNYMDSQDGTDVVKRVTEQEAAIRLLKVDEKAQEHKVGILVRHFKRLYYEFHGTKKEISDGYVITALLKDDEFYKFALYSTYENGIRFLATIDSFVKTLTANKNDSRIRQYLESSVENRKSMLKEYLKQQTNMKKYDLYDLVSQDVLTNEDVEEIKRDRWSLDLGARIIKFSTENLSDTDKQIIARRIDNLPVEETQKKVLHRYVESTDRDDRIQAIKLLDEFYEGRFLGEYNGEIMPRRGTIPNNKLAVFMESNLYRFDNATGNFKQGYGNNGKKVDFDTVNAAFELATDNEYTIVKTNRGTFLALEKTPHKSDVNIREGEILQTRDRIDETYTMTSLEARKEARDLTLSILDPSLSDGIKDRITINDCIYDPSLLSDEVQKELNGNFSPTNVYFVLRKKFIKKSMGTIGILETSQQTFYVVSHTEYKKALKTGSIPIHELNDGQTLGQYFVDGFLPSRAKKTRLRILRASERKHNELGLYNDEKNTITVYKKDLEADPLEAEFTILHEMQHAMQKDYDLPGGTSSRWFGTGTSSSDTSISTMTIPEVRQMISDFRNHFDNLPVTDTQALLTIQSYIYFRNGGEVNARGLGADTSIDVPPISIEWKEKLSNNGKKITIATLHTYWGGKYVLYDSAKKGVRRNIIAILSKEDASKDIILRNHHDMGITTYDSNQDSGVIEMSSTDNVAITRQYSGYEKYSSTKSFTELTGIVDGDNDYILFNVEKDGTLYVYLSWAALDTIYEDEYDNGVSNYNTYATSGIIDIIKDKPGKIDRVIIASYGSDTDPDSQRENVAIELSVSDATQSEKLKNALKDFSKTANDASKTDGTTQNDEDPKISFDDLSMPHENIKPTKNKTSKRGKVLAEEAQKYPNLKPFYEKRRNLTKKMHDFLIDLDPSQMQNHMDGDNLIWEEIQNGTLNRRKLHKILANEDISDYTFSVINKHFFNAPVKTLAQLDEYISMMPQLYAFRAYVNKITDADVKASLLGGILTYEEFSKLTNTIASDTYRDTFAGKVFAQALSKYPDIDVKAARLIFLKMFKGDLETASGAAAIMKANTELWSKKKNVELNENVAKDASNTTENEALEDLVDEEFDLDREAAMSSIATISREEKIKALVDSILSLGEDLMKRKGITENAVREVYSEMGEDDLNEAYYQHVINEDLKTRAEKAKLKIKNEETSTEETSTEEATIKVRSTATIQAHCKMIAQSIWKLLTKLGNEQLETFKKEHPEIFTEDGKLNSKLYSNQGREKALQLEQLLADLKQEIKESAYVNEALYEAYKRVKKELADTKKFLEEVVTKVSEKTPTIKYIYVYDHTYAVNTNTDIPSALRNLLNREYDAGSKTHVKFAADDDDTEHAKTSAKMFLENCAADLSQLTQEDADEIIHFYSHSVLLSGDMTEAEQSRYEGLEIFLLTYITEQSIDTVERNARFTLTVEQQEAINSTLTREVRISAQKIKMWQDTMNALKPDLVIAKALSRRYHLEISDADVKDVQAAVKTGDLKKIQKARERLMKHLQEKWDNKHGDFWEHLIKWQRLMMLSSPGTWLRNLVTNVIVDLGDRASAMLGQAFLGLTKYKHREGQYIITGTKVTEDIRSFVKKAFVDSGFMNLVSEGISKYDTRKSDKRSITDNVTEMILESVMSQFNFEHTFKNKKLNAVSKFVAQRLSDNHFVHKRALYYFARILVENKVDVSKFNLAMTGVEDAVNTKNDIESQKTTQSVLNMFAEAYRLASYDYMHKGSFFNDIETALQARFGNAGYFFYKQFFPFATASWNWFIAGIEYSPVGLIKAIVQLARIDKTIENVENKRQSGKVTVDPRFTEYLAKRGLGKGIIGCVCWGIGALLGALGIAKLDDEDDKIKLYVGDVGVDISNIFGTQGIFLGISFGMMFGDDNVTFMDSLTSTVNAFFEDSIISDVFNSFRNSQTLTDWFLSQPNNMLSKCIPNIWIQVMQAFTNVEYKYSSGIVGVIQKLAVKLTGPLMARTNAIPLKYDPYTGEVQTKFKVPFINSLANSLLPFKIYDYSVSDAEKEALRLNIHKEQLTGNYSDITFTAKQIAELNEYYGKLNKEDLTKLMNNKKKQKVQNEDGTYSELYYKEMSDEQKASAIRSVMSSNATKAKIKIWTSSGHKYYATTSMYEKLKESDIKKNVYKETKKLSGFVN